MKHDKELLRRRFARNFKSYDTLAAVQRDVADRLAVEIVRYARSMPDSGVEIGAGTGFLTRHLKSNFPNTQWVVNDLVGDSGRFLPAGVEFVEADGENMPLPLGVDILASSSTVQWFDDLSGFVSRAAEALSDDGILAISTFGPDNFAEITATTGQGLEYYPATLLCEWIGQTSLEVIHCQEWIQQELFATPLEVLHHLKATGVNAITPTRWTHNRLRQFDGDYRALCRKNMADQIDPDHASESAPVTLTFHPIIIVARKRAM